MKKQLLEIESSNFFIPDYQHALEAATIAFADLRIVIHDQRVLIAQLLDEVDKLKKELGK